MGRETNLDATVPISANPAGCAILIFNIGRPKPWTEIGTPLKE